MRLAGDALLRAVTGECLVCLPVHVSHDLHVFGLLFHGGPLSSPGRTGLPTARSKARQRSPHLAGLAGHDPAGDEIATINPDGSGLAPIARTPDLFVGDPDWQPLPGPTEASRRRSRNSANITNSRAPSIAA